MAVAFLSNGCAVIVGPKSGSSINRLREAAPGTVAVLPFEDQSGEPMAAGIARDALYYALADRGFRLLGIREIDGKLSDRAIAASLRRPDGRIDVQGAGRVFGTDAVAYGKIVRLRKHHLGIFYLTRFKVQLWMMDTRSGQWIWNEEASVLVRLVDLPRGLRSPTPAENQQVSLLRLCRSFSALMNRLARRLSPIPPELEIAQLGINRITVRPSRPVVSAGDRVDIAVEGTPACTGQALLGTLDKIVPLQETSRGVYTGSYTVEPGDSSSYCRVTVTLVSANVQRRRAAEARSAFVIETTPPDPPTNLAYETRPDGVLLRWNKPISPDVANYLVYRTEATTGGVRPLSRPSVNSYLDQTARHAGRYVYFVKAVDHAGNPSSSSAEVVVDLAAPGPTTVGGSYAGETRWTAYGGPYWLRLDVDVAPGARLVIEPGTEVKIPPGMEITVRGTVEAVGQPEQPIRLVGTEAKRGFFVTGPNAVLRASYVEISGAQRGVEVADGECYLDQVTLHDNRSGIEAATAKRLTVVRSTLERNRCGAVVGTNYEVRSCEFLQNDIGLCVVGDAGLLDRCTFDNVRIDIEKIGGKPLAADGNTFWTSNPSDLFRHLWGNVVCRSILARRAVLGGERPVQFDPVNVCVQQGDRAAADQSWEKALRFYESALVQERHRDIIDKALKMHKVIVDSQGSPALEREIEFCQSAVMSYPNDIALLRHLADLYSRQGNPRMAREIGTRILKIDPNDEFAKKLLAAAVPGP
jgi:hypothetical protein